MLVDGRRADTECLGRLGIGHGLVIVKGQDAPVLLCETVIYHSLQLVHQFVVLPQVLS